MIFFLKVFFFQVHLFSWPFFISKFGLCGDGTTSYCTLVELKQKEKDSPGFPTLETMRRVHIIFLSRPETQLCLPTHTHTHTRRRRHVTSHQAEQPNKQNGAAWFSVKAKILLLFCNDWCGITPPSVWLAELSCQVTQAAVTRQNLRHLRLLASVGVC